MTRKKKNRNNRKNQSNSGKPVNNKPENKKLTAEETAASPEEAVSPEAEDAADVSGMPDAGKDNSEAAKVLPDKDADTDPGVKDTDAADTDPDHKDIDISDPDLKKTDEANSDIEDVNDIDSDLEDMDDDDIFSDEDDTAGAGSDLSGDDRDTPSSDIDDEVLDLDEGQTFDDEDDVKPKKKRYRLNLNLILLIAILAVALFCVIRLWSWNRGVKIIFDPNEDTSQYDYEALDSILPLDEKLLAGHEDDGKTTIMFLGNTPLMAGGEGKRIADMTVSTLKSKGKEAEAVNAPISFSTLACINDSYDASSYADDAAALPNLADSLVSGDFAIQEADLTENHGDSTTSLENLNALEATDMNSVDVLCIFYDANDYFYGRQLISNGDKDSVNSALIYSVKKIQQNYPWIRIILMTPYYSPGVDVEGNVYDPDTTSNNIEKMPLYIMKEIQTAADLSITVVDNYYGSINGSNYPDYLDKEFHLTDKGVEKLASRFVYALTYYDAAE